ncbi:MAG TPA: hypothetical protein VHE54_19925 [Puia sp.]|nr:hypothetical protein [Puia sp.]
MYSLLSDKHRETAFPLTLRDALALGVSASDNVACDLLFRLGGGPRAVSRTTLPAKK